MNSLELLFMHQRLELRLLALNDSLERSRRRLAVDPEGDRLTTALEELSEARRGIEARIAERDQEALGHRRRVSVRERELMSGRISNSADLVKLAAEVEHLKASLAAEEEVELGLIAESEGIDENIGGLQAQLSEHRSERDRIEPELRAELERLEAQVAQTQAEDERTWDDLPHELQTEYRRLKARLRDPVAEVSNGQCQTCRVGITSNAMQVLRRAGLATCDNCDRILVLA